MPTMGYLDVNFEITKINHFNKILFVPEAFITN